MKRAKKRNNKEKVSTEELKSFRERMHTLVKSTTKIESKYALEIALLRIDEIWEQAEPNTELGR